MMSSQYLHAVLVKVFDVGVLLLGAPGVGKSSIAIALVKRGHCLVADDIVKCCKKNNKIYGCLNDPTYLGKIYIKDKGMFDLASWHDNAVKSVSKIQLGIRLIQNTKEANILDEQVRYMNILGVNTLVHDITYGDYHDICSMIEKLVRALKSYYG
ncbi:MAG: HPr kinase/phosphorylase [Francisellaceae bacterium]|jgi:HPr kinase/phosphorylase